MDLVKRGLMHVRKMSLQISLSSPSILIRGNNFRFYVIFSLKEIISKRNHLLAESVFPDKPLQTA